MSSHDLVNLIHQEVGRAMSGRFAPRDVVCTSYDPDRHAIKGALQPGGQETGWIPLGSQMVGNGFGVAMGATPGEIYQVVFDTNDLQTGRVHGRHYSDEDAPPKVESGEMVMMHKDKAAVKFDKDGHYTVTQESGSVSKHYKDGTIGVEPGAGKKVYLGKVDGAGCARVMTESGPSPNVYAKVV